MVKLPFRGKSSGSDNLPTEIKEYYQTERRERVGVAWLLALGTLLLTLVLATGLFFGGRWAYRKIAGNDKPGGTAQTQTSEDPAAGQEGGTQGQNTGVPAATDGQTGTSSATTSTPSPAASATPPASTPPAALPNTGPSEIIGLAAAVTVAGTAAHSAVWSRRNRQ